MMRGSIQKKGKKWYDGVNPATGQYRRRWVQVGTRRGDAEKLLAELVKRSNQGETVVSEKLTLGEYLAERWLPVQEARLRTSTCGSYRCNIELHVIPALGKRQLDQLTPEDIDVFYAALLKGGRRKRPGEKGPVKGLAPKTVHNVHVAYPGVTDNGSQARPGTAACPGRQRAETSWISARPRSRRREGERGERGNASSPLLPTNAARADRGVPFNNRSVTRPGSPRSGIMGRGLEDQSLCTSPDTARPAR